MSMPDRRELTFPIAMDRALMWLLAGLMTWLCYSTMNMREQMTLVLERSDTSKENFKIIHAELERLTSADSETAKAVKKVELKQAEHGWK